MRSLQICGAPAVSTRRARSTAMSSKADRAFAARYRVADQRAHPATGPRHGALLGRFAEWWVIMEPSEELIRIGGAGTSTAEGAGNAVIRAQIERLCGIH